MKFDIESLTLEVTRKCNLACEHCMRGDAKNVNMTYDVIDKVLDNEEINSINQLGFSGGEPTLVPDLIIYTIDKITLS